MINEAAKGEIRKAQSLCLFYGFESGLCEEEPFASDLSTAKRSTGYSQGPALNLWWISAYLIESVIRHQWQFVVSVNNWSFNCVLSIFNLVQCA